ncbi:MFS transporter [Actinacidiphila soli]|uniref:MFS transporter n=1 Tax=Actinacidiphila soli TaxID=2487275 RepID=UPI000FCA37B2|nr:MFS transporter [Actinacidiphila soli]
MTAGVPLPEALTVSVRYQPKTAAMRRYTRYYALASLGITLLWGVSSILLPLQVQQLEFHHLFTGADAHVSLTALNHLKTQVEAGQVSPTADQRRLLSLLARFNSSQATGLSVVTSVGVFATMLIQPLVGTLSDRTRSKRGRRAPWIAGGACAGAALVALLPAAPGVAALAVLWSLAQLTANIAAGPLSATVIDRVPEDRIGGVSAITGLAAYFGAILGAVLAGALFSVIGLSAYFPIAVTLALAPLAFVLLVRDRSSKDLTVERPQARTVLGSYVLAFGDRDYRLAWIAKVLLFVGYSVAGVYTVYMLQSYVHPALSASAAAHTASLIQVAGLPSALIGMAVSGPWSDRIRRRKPFVVAASVIMTVALLIPLVWPTLAGMYLMAVINGLGFGTYIVVDQALFIDVLPHREAAGRDLGLASLGQNLGQALGPVLAGAVVAVSGGAYGPIWPVASAWVLVAALVVAPIKRVR